MRLSTESFDKDILVTAPNKHSHNEDMFEK
jgi:hypothetical protein